MAALAIVNHSQHGMQVHKAGCADLAKLSPFKATVWVTQCETREDVVNEVYADMLAESDTPWTEYLWDFKFFPCTKLI